MEVLSSSKPVPGFQGGTVRHTTVTKMGEIRHGFGHYSSYTFYPIWALSRKLPSCNPVFLYSCLLNYSPFPVQIQPVPLLVGVAESEGAWRAGLLLSQVSPVLLEGWPPVPGKYCSTGGLASSCPR